MAKNLADEYCLQAATSLLDFKVLMDLRKMHNPDIKLRCPDIRVMLVKNNSKAPPKDHRLWRTHIRSMREEVLHFELSAIRLDCVKKLVETAPRSLRTGIRLFEDIPLFESTLGIEQWIEKCEHPEAMRLERMARDAQGEIDHVVNSTTDQPLSELFEGSLQSGGG